MAAPEPFDGYPPPRGLLPEPVAARLDETGDVPGPGPRPTSDPTPDSRTPPPPSPGRDGNPVTPGLPHDPYAGS